MDTTTPGSRTYEFLTSHDNAFKTNILNRFPGLMATMRVGPDARRKINEGIFERLINDKRLENIEKLYQTTYKSFVNFDSKHRFFQNDTKKAFLDEKSDIIQLVPNHLNSINKNPKAQQSYSEHKAWNYLVKIGLVGECIDECRLALKRKKKTCKSDREMRMYEMQAAESLKFLEEITKILKINLDQTMKIPCIPIFLKSLDDGKALRGLNRCPELKASLKKVKGNIRHPEKKSSCLSPEIEDFEGPMQQIIPAGGYWIEMDQDMIWYKIRNGGSNSFVTVQKGRMNKIIEENTEETSTEDVLSIHLQKLGLFEWAYLSKRVKHLLKAVENSRSELRQFCMELLNAEYEWMRQFRNREEVVVPPDLKCPPFEFLSDFDIPVELKQEITDTAIDVIVAMIEHLRKTKPELRDVILPIQEEFIQLAKEKGDMTQLSYEDWLAAQQAVPAGEQQEAPAVHQGPDLGLWHVKEDWNVPRRKPIETITILSDTEDEEDGKDTEEKEPKGTSAQPMPSHPEIINPASVYHGNVAVPQFYSYPNYPHPAVPAHLIPAPLQPGEKEKYAHIKPHRDAPPPPVQETSAAFRPCLNEKKPMPFPTLNPLQQLIYQNLNYYAHPQNSQYPGATYGFDPNYSHVPLPTSPAALIAFLNTPADPNLDYFNPATNPPRAPEPEPFYQWF